MIAIIRKPNYLVKWLLKPELVAEEEEEEEEEEKIRLQAAAAAEREAFPQAKCFALGIQIPYILVKLN